MKVPPAEHSPARGHEIAARPSSRPVLESCGGGASSTARPNGRAAVNADTAAAATGARHAARMITLAPQIPAACRVTRLAGFLAMPRHYGGPPDRSSSWYGRAVLGGAPFIGFIPVRDTAAARDFYEGILGLHVVEQTSFALVVDAHGTMLRLTGVPELTPQPFSIAGWEVPDIAATVRQLGESGVRFLRYDGMGQDELRIWTSPGGDMVAWFQDPDDNVLSVTTFAAR